jgi:hypothetical protein
LLLSFLTDKFPARTSATEGFLGLRIALLDPDTVLPLQAHLDDLLAASLSAQASDNSMTPLSRTIARLQ